mgnify:CR=1 FL=1
MEYELNISNFVSTPTLDGQDWGEDPNSIKKSGELQP